MFDSVNQDAAQHPERQRGLTLASLPFRETIRKQGLEISLVDHYDESAVPQLEEVEELPPCHPQSQKDQAAQPSGSHAQEQPHPESPHEEEEMPFREALR